MAGFELVNLLAVIDNLSQGVVVLDRSHRVVLWNRWMEESSRIGREAILGRPIGDFFPCLGKKGFYWKVQNVFKLGNYAFFSQHLHQYLFDLPAERYLEPGFDRMQQNVTLSPLRDETGQVAYVCVSVVDETDAVIYRDRLERLTRQLEAMSRTDHLTGLPNRRHLFERLEEELARHRRLKQPLSLAIVDLDHFKSVNDTHGHLCGDQVLVQTARLLQLNLRPYDFVGRYGGEEFALVLPNTGQPQALTVLERFQKAMAENAFTCLDGENCTSLNLTASAGVVSTTRTGDFDLDDLLKMADDALYRAKNSGRNRVESVLAG